MYLDTLFLTDFKKRGGFSYYSHFSHKKPVVRTHKTGTSDPGQEGMPFASDP